MKIFSSLVCQGFTNPTNVQVEVEKYRDVLEAVGSKMVEPINRQVTSYFLLSFVSCKTMKIATAFSLALVAVNTEAFAPRAFGVSRSTSLNAEIRGPTEKSEELRFGWDGTTALGGAVEVAAPTRMLDQILESGETIHPDCEVFNANVEMDADSLKFQEVMDLINTHYEVGLITFKNGDIVNGPGENEGSAMVLSYAALSQMDKDTTLKVSSAIGIFL